VLALKYNFYNYMLFTQPTTLLFVGDSITDCGRDRESGGSDLGTGYVAQVQALLNAHHPEAKVRYLNMGISGNRVTDLEARWDVDVLAHQPDWVSVMIGINDVWRQFDNPLVEQVSLQFYSEKLQGLVERTLPRVQGMIDRYGAAAHAVAERNELHFVDVQAAFNAWLVHNHAAQLCADRVHPNAVGHNIIASAFLNAIGFEW
jgi:lysophospholipase L1-like esterase